MRNIHKLTEGALFLAIFAVILLITLYIPLVGIIINLFLSLPFIMFSAKNDRKSSFVFLVGSVLISMIVGTMLAIPLALTYGLTGIIIGDFIREKKSRFASFIAGSLVFLLALVIQYGVAVAFFDMNFIKESTQILEESMQKSQEIMGSLGTSPNQNIVEQFQTSIDMIKQLMPTLFVISSFTIVFIIQLLNFPIIKRFGITIPEWKPFKELSLPKSLLWYYLICYIVSVFFRPGEETFVYTALVNITFILQLFMILQGLSFIFFYSNIKRLPKALPVVVIILLFFMPIVLYIVRILGIIDLGFDLKRRIGKKQ